MLLLLSLYVTLVFIDPPDPPQNLQVLQVGSSWATIKWLPPENVGPLPPLSFYEIVATPQLRMYYSEHDVTNSNDSIPVSRTSIELSQHQKSSLGDYNNSFAAYSLARGLNPNTTCIEFMCERITVRIDAKLTIFNLSGLIPALSYELAVHSLSNGANLISRPSAAVSITTKHSGEFFGYITMHQIHVQNYECACLIIRI